MLTWCGWVQRTGAVQWRRSALLAVVLCDFCLAVTANASNTPLSAVVASQQQPADAPQQAASLASELSPELSSKKRCLYISSYHQGYEWNDGIERGMESVLQQQCELQHFYMDTKRHPEPEWAEKKAREALALIKRYKPDVLLVADDNASRFLVMPYLRDADLPVVFGGLNWTVGEYGYPYRNATGMVEVAPILPLLKQLRRILPSVHRALFLSSDVATERKDFLHYQQLFSKNDVALTASLVSNFAEWKQAYLYGQEFDFILLNNNAGIRDWQREDAIRFVLENGRVLSVTNYDWMVPYVAFAIIKVPQEQGEWMARVALSILRGVSPEDIPIIPNRRWEAWLNSTVVQRLRIELPHSLILKAKTFP